MYIEYADILSRIDEKPTWWLNGVPRYGPFNPNDVDIYAKCVALFHTKCRCGTDYFQAIGSSLSNDIESLKDSITNDTVCMGDPPNACSFLSEVECSSQADSVREIAVVEFWESVDWNEYRSSGAKWKRNSDFETSLTDHFSVKPVYDPIELSTEERKKVDEANELGGKINAWKTVSELTGASLSSAKYWVDENL